jgi:natural product biosynthesis luciferase-like monooxygenase protein
MTIDLTDRLAALPPEKRRLLRERLESRRKGWDGQPRELRFSVFFFGDRRPSGAGLYDLLLRSARLADEGGLWAIWTPERHFHEFGGAYPDPAVLGAAIAMSTRRLQIRAGSVVLPINDTVRVAERWSMVDNLSQGRVGVSLAAGWHPDDFVLARRGYCDRHRVFAEQSAVLARLWRGESVELRDPDGGLATVRIYPRPLQERLPLWITCSKAPEPWLLAARMGANVLTGLLEQSVEQLADSVRMYRRELARAGHDPESTQVSVMIHTYVGAPGEEVRAVVRGPLSQYLRNHLQFYETMMGKRADLDVDLAALSAEDREALVQKGVDRYLETSSLIGGVDECRQQAARLAALGIDELACLVNFGMPEPLILGGVERLSEVAAAFRPRAVAVDAPA